jgi:glycosyltransferase involved in cell wall biosynthesis
VNEGGAVAGESVLMIGWVDVETQPNHRFFHMVEFFSERFQHVDFVSYSNLYGGPPTSWRQKVIKSIHHLIRVRCRVHQERNVRHIVIRKLKLPQFLQNVVGDIWSYVNLREYLRSDGYGLCVFSHPQNVLLVSLLKRHGSLRKIIYDDCDYFPGHLGGRGPFSSLVLSWREQRAVEMADGVVSVTNALADLRRQQGAKRVIVVPNGVELDCFMKARVRGPHPPTLIYVGYLGEAWGVDLVLRALPIIKWSLPDARLIIVGYGEQSAELEALTRQLGLQDAVTFYGKKPYGELAEYLSRADMGVAIYRAREFLKYSSPLKIREYLAAGLPVIASAEGESREIIERSRGGELVEASPDAIAKVATKILSDRALYDEYSANGAAYAAGFAWDTVLRPAFELGCGA